MRLFEMRYSGLSWCVKYNHMVLLKGAKRVKVKRRPYDQGLGWSDAAMSQRLTVVSSRR